MADLLLFVLSSRSTQLSMKIVREQIDWSADYCLIPISDGMI